VVVNLPSVFIHGILGKKNKLIAQGWHGGWVVVYSPSAWRMVGQVNSKH